jgi:TPR repeat protein
MQNMNIAPMKPKYLYPAQASQRGKCRIPVRISQGLLHRTGVPKDSKQGLEWLRKSASQGYAAAEYQLGAMFRDGGAGVSKNPHEAALWFRKAARQQNEPAQSELAQMLRKGAISREEGNWKASESIVKPREPVTEAKADKPKPFSLLDVEKACKVESPANGSLPSSTSLKWISL